MIRNNRFFWRATVLACTLAGCQNQMAPTAPEPHRTGQIRQDSTLAPAVPHAPGESASGGTVAPSKAALAAPATQAVPAGPRKPGDPADAGDPAAASLAPPAATDSSPVDLPDLEPEFVNPPDLTASRQVSNVTVPAWPSGTPSYGWLPERPPVSAPIGYPTGLVGSPPGSWDDPPVPGATFGLADPAVWSGNPNDLSFGADPRLFQQIPPEIPASVAGRLLYPISPGQISAGFAPDEFRGLPGTYVGFAPGFSYHFLRRCRFLYAGGVLIPFVLAGSRYVPVVLFAPRYRLFIYPGLIYVGGALAPIYHVVPFLFEPYSLAFPIPFGGAFSSPLDILQVPGPALFRPVLLRERRFRHADHELFSRIRFLKEFRPRIGLARHKVEVIRTRIKIRQKIRYR